jgi:hypothetical protein
MLPELPKSHFNEHLAIYFDDEGKTNTYEGIDTALIETTKAKHSRKLAYFLLAFDIFEFTGACITGFDPFDYLTIGLTTLALGFSWLGRNKFLTNFFRIEGDVLSFSRFMGGGEIMSLLMNVRILKPTIVKVAASQIQQIEIQLDEAIVLMKNGKKEALGLGNLEAKRTIQDALLYFCEKNGISCQISGLATKEREGLLR